MKAAAARRLMELFQFLDDLGRPALVGEICARCGWPASSTRELLAVLVQCGLLYRNEKERTFQPTPRAAYLGAGAQPAFVRDGRIQRLSQDLNLRTRLPVTLLGRVNAAVHVFWRSRHGRNGGAGRAGPGSGATASLAESAAGWLLLSTLAPELRSGLLRRLRAEAAPDQAFVPAEIEDRARACAARGATHGPAGFAAGDSLCGVLVPGVRPEHAVVLACILGPNDQACADQITAILREGALSLAQPPDNRLVSFDDLVARRRLIGQSF